MKRRDFLKSAVAAGATTVVGKSIAVAHPQEDIDFFFTLKEATQHLEAIYYIIDQAPNIVTLLEHVGVSCNYLCNCNYTHHIGIRQEFNACLDEQDKNTIISCARLVGTKIVSTSEGDSMMERHLSKHRLT